MSLYPMHEVTHKEGQPGQYRGPCGSLGAMLLLEQVNREPDGNALWCLRCNKQVPASQQEHAAAFAAAHDEGWRPKAARTLPLTPGDLSEATRLQLAGLLRLERLGPAPSANLPQKAWETAREEASTKHADGFARKLVATDEAHPYGILTPEGRALAALILAPEVPAAVVSATSEKGYASGYAKHGKEPRKPKARVIEPSLPMVCTCGCTVGMHTSGAPRGQDVRCRGKGGTCGCDRYRQAKPVKPVKEAKVKTPRVRKATATPGA